MYKLQQVVYGLFVESLLLKQYFLPTNWIHTAVRGMHTCLHLLYVYLRRFDHFTLCAI